MANRPRVVSTLISSDTSAASIIAGGTVGSTTGTGGLTAGVIDTGPVTINSTVPGVTTFKLYNNAGSLFWNGAALAAGSSVSGTTGQISKFTSSSSLGNSIMAESAGVIAVAGSATVSGTLGVTGTSTLGTVNGSGSISLVAAVNTPFGVSVSNTTGTAAESDVLLIAGTNASSLQAYSQGFTTSGYQIASSLLLHAGGAAGIVYNANDASGMHRWYNAGSERMRLHASGGLSLGNTTDPGSTALSVTGTIKSAKTAISSPYTLPTWSLYDDGSNWAHLVYGLDAALRVTFSKTSAASPLYFGTSSANDGTGAFTLSATLSAAGALTLVGGLTATTGTFSGAMTFNSTTAATFGGGVSLINAAKGTGAVPGQVLTVGRNNSGSGAAGILNFVKANGVQNVIWIDSSANPGDLRIAAQPPLENGSPGDTSGTVVGTQTSTLDTKVLLGNDLTPRDALETMLATPVKQFRYKGGSYSGTVFQGVVTDWSPAFGMDPDAAHPNGRSFNPVNGLGYTIQAVKAIDARLAALEARKP